MTALGNAVNLIKGVIGKSSTAITGDIDIKVMGVLLFDGYIKQQIS